MLHLQSQKGDIAQLVEQRTENPCVLGSNPSITTKPSKKLEGFFVSIRLIAYKLFKFNIAAIITIPLVVHVVWNRASQNISDAQILSQIRQLCIKIDIRIKIKKGLYRKDTAPFLFLFSF